MTNSTEFMVTYHNTLLDKRCILIDGIDEVTADSIVMKFSGTAGDPYRQLSDVRKERVLIDSSTL